MTFSETKVRNTRKVLAASSLTDLIACRDGYAKLDNPAARAIVLMAEAEIASR